MPNYYRIINSSDKKHLGHVIDLDDSEHIMPNGYVMAPEGNFPIGDDIIRVWNTSYLIDVEPV